MRKESKRILLVVGTRPNFVKITQFPKLCKGRFDLTIVHTGQHSDDKMALVFFQQFGFTPDLFLDTERGSTEVQMASITKGLEKVCADLVPDLMIVVGDVNSTVAAARVASKMKIKLAHVESGLRSFDLTMPEEHNRIATDNISDHFFVTEQSGIDNLLKEGNPSERIHFVGNTMIDTLVAFQSQIDASGVLQKLVVEEKQFVLMTMHRPATVDFKEGLGKLVELINDISKKYKIVFPIHPRTLKNFKELNLSDDLDKNKNLVLTEPLDYFSFQKLVKSCKLIITDSGGIQEESTFLRVPCLTLRNNTERPSTITIGSNELVPFNLADIRRKILEIEEGKFKKGGIPPLWDGKATERIVDVLLKEL